MVYSSSDCFFRVHALDLRDTRYVFSKIYSSWSLLAWGWDPYDTALHALMLVLQCTETCIDYDSISKWFVPKLRLQSYMG